MRFGEIGGEVIIRTSVYRFSFSDSPNGVGLNPQLRQAAASLDASGGSEVGKFTEYLTIKSN